MKSVSHAKIAPPRLHRAIPRERLFNRLDSLADYPVTWISSPAGSGKTTLIANWLDDRKLSCLWYQIDAGDGDIATFFYYLGLAAKKAAPKKAARKTAVKKAAKKATKKAVKKS